MQTARAYDTHKMVKEMIVLGFTEKQSEGVVNLFGQVQGDLATKSDLQEIRAELKSDLKEVKMQLEYQINQVENKIDKEIGSVRAEIGSVRAELGMLRAELQTNFKWLYVIGTGLVIALLAPYLQNLIHLIK